MLNWIIKLLPPEKRALMELAIRVTSNLYTADDRRIVAEYGIKMLSPDSEGGSRVTVSEWARFGSKLGVLKGRQSNT
tara:strand:- start:387 stop:617 length:231 start_codon:yes stop_codon:yes gene_type:complete